MPVQQVEFREVTTRDYLRVPVYKTAYYVHLALFFVVCLIINPLLFVYSDNCWIGIMVAGKGENAHDALARIFIWQNMAKP